MGSQTRRASDRYPRPSEFAARDFREVIIEIFKRHRRKYNNALLDDLVEAFFVGTDEAQFMASQANVERIAEEFMEKYFRSRK